MRNVLPRVIVAVLFVAVVALPLVWAHVGNSSQHAAPTPGAVPGVGGDESSQPLRLILYSPHNEQIRYEVALAFSQWHEQKFGRPVTFDWRTVGGTSDIERILKSQYATLARDGREEDGVGVDLVFGGGDYSFDRVLKRGIDVPKLDKDGQPLHDDKGNVRMRNVPLTQPIEIDPAIKATAFPTPTIADKKLYDPDGHWWGVVLSSFGIVYNRDVLETLDLPEPVTWSDLAEPRYIGWVALADPSHSGSVKVTYEAILQRYGWERGMKVLRRVFANSRYFAPGSTQIPIDISAGEAAAGMCIDYYGRQQAETVGDTRVTSTDKLPGGRVGYVAPADATVITADPIAVLRGAPHKELAIKFIEFLLTERGQALWDFKVGDPWGPQKFALRRAPIRRDIYEKYMDRLIDKDNPFTIAKPLPPGVPSYFSVIPVLTHSMCMDIHDDLRQAWVTINNTKDPALKAKMLELFDAMPDSIDNPEKLSSAPKLWKDKPHVETRMRLEWTAFFRDHYRQIIDMAP